MCPSRAIIRLPFTMRSDANHKSEGVGYIERIASGFLIHKTRAFFLSFFLFLLLSLSKLGLNGRHDARDAGTAKMEEAERGDEG